jgi:hypothetical protein
MAVTAQSILTRVIEVLQDADLTRWKLDELCRHFNDGQRVTATLRPDATAQTTSWVLSVGARQTLPVTAAKLIEVVRNTGGKKRAVRLAPRAIIDALLPNWHNMTPVTEIIHYMHDLRDPRTVYVYPPAASGASLESVFSLYPTDITVPSPTAALGDVTGQLSLADHYADPMVDYILYRAYLKDAEVPENDQRANAHFTMYANALGVELKSAMAVSPDQSGDSNRPPAAV